jgi:hypothetical protein
MECDGCGERMQRQTVVLVTRKRIGKSREIRPGWYCWTCRASTPDVSAQAAARRSGLAEASWAGLGAWRDCSAGGRVPEARV